MNKSATTACVIGVAAVVAAAIFLIDPCAANWLPGCPLHTLTGLYCPGCGSTRALHQLAHGHVARAFGFNPLAVLALPLLAWLVLRRRPAATLPAGWIWTLVGVIAAFGVLRNIPTYPFTLLAP